MWILRVFFTPLFVYNVTLFLTLHAFIFVIHFQRFNYDVPWCVLHCVHPDQMLRLLGEFKIFIFFIKFWKNLAIISSNEFHFPHSSSNSDYYHTKTINVVPQAKHCLCLFFQLSSVHFILNNFYCYVFKFTVLPSAYVTSYLVKLSFRIV